MNTAPLHPDMPYPLRRDDHSRAVWTAGIRPQPIRTVTADTVTCSLCLGCGEGRNESAMCPQCHGGGECMA